MDTFGRRISGVANSTKAPRATAMRMPTNSGSASAPRKPAWIRRRRTLPTSDGDTGTFEPTLLTAAFSATNLGPVGHLVAPADHFGQATVHLGAAVGGQPHAERGDDQAGKDERE